MNADLSTRHEIPPTADVVIIGGGPAGAAALWALARQAPGLNIVLIEKSDRLGAGSSLASLENFRTCWPALCLAKQMARSVHILQNADDYLGEGASASLAVKTRGYLFCAFNEQQAAALQADVAHLHSIGLNHIEFLNTAALRARFGWLDASVIAAKYDPQAGWLDSNALVYRYVQSAPKARVLLGISHTAIRVEGQRVTGVRTSAGDIAAPFVIIAAGAASREIGRTAGIDLPLIVRPRQSFTTGWRHENFPEDAPMLIGAAPHPHVRPEAQSGAIFGWEYNWHQKAAPAEHHDTDQINALQTPVERETALKDPRFPSITLALLARQFGHVEGQGFADPRYLKGLSHNIGYYVYRDGSAAFKYAADGTAQPYESERAIIDRWPGVDGLFVSVAHVGHGIMSSPAAGEIVASLVLDQPLAEPAYHDFSLARHWVEHDEAVL